MAVPENPGRPPRSTRRGLRCGRLRPASAFVVATAVFAATLAPGALAGDPIEYKLTIGAYRTSADVDSIDVNLRARGGPHTGWIGYYHDSGDIREPRAGYEYAFESELLRPTLSLQLASGGFRGWALSSEIGPRSLYGIAGFGRTNLREYVNLNFDPNDAFAYGFGTRPSDRLSFALFRIQDDRLDTGQKVTHAVCRALLPADVRLVVDLFHKRGGTDTGRHIVANGISVTVEYGHWFVRLASDPYVNFTEDRMTRVSVGARF